MAWVGLEAIPVRNAPIGYYDEEKRIGNDFEVRIAVEKDLGDPGSDVLGDTVNYEILHQTVQQVMREPMDLIETAAYRIFEGLKTELSGSKQVLIRIKKFYPIQGVKGGHSFVEMTFDL